MKFSEKLIKEYQQYMLKKYKEVISDEDAQLHLASLSRLFTLFAKQDEKKSQQQTNS